MTIKTLRAVWSTCGRWQNVLTNFVCHHYSIKFNFVIFKFNPSSQACYQENFWPIRIRPQTQISSFWTQFNILICKISSSLSTFSIKYEIFVNVSRVFKLFKLCMRMQFHYFLMTSTNLFVNTTKDIIIAIRLLIVGSGVLWVHLSFIYGMVIR